MEASIMEFKEHTRKYLEALEHQECVNLTYRGVRKAILIPVCHSTGRLVKCSDFPACGMWAEREDMQNVEEYVNKLRTPRRFQ